MDKNFVEVQTPRRKSHGVGGDFKTWCYLPRHWRCGRKPLLRSGGVRGRHPAGNEQARLAQVRAQVEVGTRPEIDLLQQRTAVANAHHVQPGHRAHGAGTRARVSGRPQQVNHGKTGCRVLKGCRC